MNDDYELGWRDGYKDGDRDGYARGWHEAMRTANADKPKVPRIETAEPIIESDS